MLIVIMRSLLLSILIYLNKMMILQLLLVIFTLQKIIIHNLNFVVDFLHFHEFGTNYKLQQVFREY